MSGLQASKGVENDENQAMGKTSAEAMVEFTQRARSGRRKAESELTLCTERRKEDDADDDESAIGIGERHGATDWKGRLVPGDEDALRGGGAGGKGLLRFVRDEFWCSLDWTKNLRT